MGLPEIIFSTIIFIIIWFIIFKLKLKYDKKKPLKNIGTKIENQDKKIFNIFGKSVRAGEVVDEEIEKEVEKEVKKLDGEGKKKNPRKKAVKKTAKKTIKKVPKKKK